MILLNQRWNNKPTTQTVIIMKDQNKVLEFISNRKHVKSAVRLDVKDIMIELHDGWVFNEEEKNNVSHFMNVREASKASSSRSVINLNAPEEKPRKKVSKVPKADEGNKENKFSADDYVYPTVDRDKNGKVLSMTPNAIRKRNARKAKA